MANERLAKALAEGVSPSAVTRRMEAVKMAAKHRGLYFHCGFCTKESGQPLLSGPISGICEECTQLAGGFYLAKFRRQTQKLSATYDECFREAVRDYSLEYGKAPEMQQPEPQPLDRRGQ